MREDATGSGVRRSAEGRLRRGTWRAVREGKVNVPRRARHASSLLRIGAASVVARGERRRVASTAMGGGAAAGAQTGPGVLRVVRRRNVVAMEGGVPGVMGGVPRAAAWGPRRGAMGGKNRAPTPRPGANGRDMPRRRRARGATPHRANYRSGERRGTTLRTQTAGERGHSAMPNGVGSRPFCGLSSQIGPDLFLVGN